MSAEYATFGLAPATRAGGLLAGGDYQVHRDFVDFVVDGRPLLYRLSDLDAVSPLASDVPPSLFTAQVRALLLETGAPLPGGRYVVYGCPECEDLACGAVTAVIERDGEDVVWRDFAWQTAEDADLERDGYHGMGPFRFHGPEYRAALSALLDGDLPGSRRRVLLIGARAAPLARLAAALRTIGIGADITQSADRVPADELRAYGAVLFGRAVPARERDTVRRVLADAGAEVPCVDALAPVVPLLVAQTEQALEAGRGDRRRLTGLTVTGSTAEFEVLSACRVRLTAHRIDRLSRARGRDLFDGVLAPGRHRVPLDAPAVKGEAYVVARTAGTVLVAAARP
ncbi:oxidoreductase [Streptomyces sp. Vc74B-19]|uniref:oxidoreductase n=1 Tax=unclassified Streptomyces TaxID=2593676 RepID=UPI001BFC47FB|nr:MULTISPECIES: oxidoreductase [unclassified Streptomyces]MBT3164121.1 oxidoreductase [Streptomyces sp. Vc74B-19]MDU0300057.1 oxidoreductase [Streptomyces sp. PAL114]